VLAATVRDLAAFEQPAARQVETPAEQVVVRRDSVAARERPNQVRSGNPEDGCDGSYSYCSHRIGIEDLAGPAGYRGSRRERSCRRAATEVPAEALHDQSEAGLSFEVVAVDQRLVEPGRLVSQDTVHDQRSVDGRANKHLLQHVLLEVNHSLAEAARGYRSAIVNHVRRQQRHAGARCSMPAMLQLVPDQTIVDEQDRPGVMRMSGIHVITPLGMKHLRDARDPRSPRTHLIAGSHP
jgi:hypothetical protein